MPAEPLYNEASIQSLEGLAAIRKRPTAYLPDTEAAGLTHQANELVHNSLDELTQLYATELQLGLLRITLLRDLTQGYFQLLIRDNGRGIPIGRLVAAVTKLHTSGKFDTASYTTSAGLYGLGMTVSAGLSHKFRIISQRNEAIAGLLIEDGNHQAAPDLAAPTGATGVSILYQPDATKFTGILEYAETGYLGLLELLKKYVFFTAYPIEFRILDQAVPDALWTTPIHDFLAAMADLEQQADLIWSTATHDREDWIRHYWHITRPFAWRYALQKTSPISDALHAYHIRLFYVKFEPKGDYFGLINNIPIDQPSSNHLSVVHEQLVQAIAERISDAAVRKFFLESYRLPLFIAADVKYQGAQPSGTTKYAFTSAPFRESYRAEISSQLATASAQWALTELFSLLEGDINARYMQSLSGTGRAKVGMNRLFLELNRPTKFRNCNTKNRSLAELFLVEGASAGGAVGHDTEIQATYELGGKPKNVISDNCDHTSMLRDVLHNEIYQDIFRIINFDPLHPSMANLNFGRCLIFSDGDAHGRHIAALLIGTMQVAAPELLKSGFFGIVAPPYYEIWAGRRKTVSTYVRDQKDLIQWKAINIYDRELAVDIVYYHAGQQVLTKLSCEQLVLLSIIVANIGMAIENIANEFSLPGLLIEALTRVTYYLTPATMDTTRIKASLDADRVEYHPSINTLIISIGREDYVIPLFHVQDRICAQVSSILQRVQWRNWDVLISSKRNTERHNEAVSLYQLYELFKHLDRLITVEVLKGIGSMSSTEAARVCMDVRNRRVFDITAPGDVEVIFNLLGDDPQPRKDLMKAPPITDYQRAVL